MDLKRLVVSRGAFRPGRRVAAGTTERLPAVSAVDFDPTLPKPPDAAAPAEPEEPPPTMDWRSSSYDLLSGVEIRDHSESIPRELFDRLFRN